MFADITDWDSPSALEEFQYVDLSCPSEGSASQLPSSEAPRKTEDQVEEQIVSSVKILDNEYFNNVVLSPKSSSSSQSSSDYRTCKRKVKAEAKNE